MRVLRRSSLRIHDQDGCTALHFAAFGGHTEATRILSEHGGRSLVLADAV